MTAQKTLQHIRVASRRSPLARIQVDEIQDRLKAAGITTPLEVDFIDSKGDLDRVSTLDGQADDNFFTDSLDAAVFSGQADIAVHSAKDVPKDLAEGLSIIALTESPDTSDALVGDAPLAQLPAGARIGTSSAYRKAELLKIRPDVEPVPIRGTIQERIDQYKDGTFDAIIVATVALKRLGLEELIKDILPWEATALQGQLAVVARSDNEDVRKVFEPLDCRRKYGTVHLVGAGPGDPELIALKAVRILAQADVVFYDYLVHKDILKHAPYAQKIYVGKRKGEHSLHQRELCKKLRLEAQQGRDVVRLKGGDPLVFGRGGEEIEYLHEYHIPYHVVPGITSATGILSGLGIPLTARDVSSSVAFVSAHVREESSDQPQPINIPKADTIIFFMGLSKADMIRRELLSQGKEPSTPVALVSRGTFIDQKVVTGELGELPELIREHDIKAPALIVVGHTVRFWKSKGGIKKNILFTGTNPEKYTSMGRIIHFPMIQIGPLKQPAERVEAVIKDMQNYDAVLITSQFGVRYFHETLKAHGLDMSSLKDKEFFVIGRHTADTLAEFGIFPSIMANLETSAGMLQQILEQYDVKDKRILFPRSNLPNPYLKDKLTEAGAVVDEFPVYENTKAEKRPLPKEKIDTVFFTSPSTVRNFLADYTTIDPEWKIIAKGDVTAKFIEEKGYTCEILINT